MMPLEMFTVRNFGIGNIATLFIYAAFTFGPFALTVFLQEVGGTPRWPRGDPAAVLMLIALASFFGVGRRIGPRVFMTVGPLVCAVISAHADDDVEYVLDPGPAGRHGVRSRHGHHGRRSPLRSWRRRPGQAVSGRPSTTPSPASPASSPSPAPASSSAALDPTATTAQRWYGAHGGRRIVSWPASATGTRRRQPAAQASE
jgi:hypothetical protein